MTRNFEELMEAQAWNQVGNQPPGPASAGFQAGIQHERNRITALLRQRASLLELMDGSTPRTVVRELRRFADEIDQETC